MKAASVEPVPLRDSSKLMLVMRGGGVKGIAFAGAIEVLEKHFQFDIYAGTSAGSIAAILMAAGYKGDELRGVLHNAPLSDFLDGKWWRYPFDFIFSGGLHRGDSLHQWVEARLAEKVNLARISLESIQANSGKRVILFAADSRFGTLPFDSAGENFGIYSCRCSPL